MPQLKDFATSKYPLRASRLPALVECAWRQAFMFLGLLSDSSGPAADTGSATHEAVKEWHRGSGIEPSVTAMRGRIQLYPSADLADAEAMFRLYTKDERNKTAKLRFVEEKVEFQLPAVDPAQEAIHVIGTLDQVREQPDGLYLYDVKTTKKDGWSIMLHHTMQVAAYCIGAAKKLGQPVHPGALILTRKYKGSKPPWPGVFFHYPFRYEDCLQVLDSVRAAVHNVRAGLAGIGPGEWCSHCPAGGIDRCVPMRGEHVPKPSV